MGREKWKVIQSKLQRSFWMEIGLDKFESSCRKTGILWEQRWDWEKVFIITDISQARSSFEDKLKDIRE